MYNELLNKAIKLQNNSKLGLSKDENDYAFTFIYPPSQVLYKLDNHIFKETKIDNANLYLHIPYCTGKCTYCYFGCYSISTAPISKSDYIEYMCREMDLLYQKYGKIKIESIHFGGGTPTILNEKEINYLFSKMRQSFSIEKDIEITYESSPETITKSKITTLIDNGVNRLNIGIQTLNDDLLASINRRHNAQKALDSICLSQDLGLKNINVDVMYGLNGQTLDDWITTLNKILSMNVQSISTYRLRLHPKGKIRNEIESFSETNAINMYIKMLEMMDNHHYFQCSSHKFAIQKEFAQKQIINKRGVVNNALLPIGMAAYGYINNVLYWNERTIQQYAEKLLENKLPVSIGYVLSKSEEIAKVCVLGIHNVNGIDLEKFTRKFNEKIEDRYGVLIKNLINHDLIKMDNNRMTLTKLGMVFADEIATMFYSPSVKKQLKDINKKYGIFFDQIIQ